MPRYLDRSSVMRVGERFAKLCKQLSLEHDITYPEITNRVAQKLENDIRKTFTRK